MEGRQPRKLAVILHADVVGSTTLVQQNETLAHDRIQDAFRRFSETIEVYGGVAHELRGDALVASFTRDRMRVAARSPFRPGTQSSTRRSMTTFGPSFAWASAWGRWSLPTAPSRGRGGAGAAFRTVSRARRSVHPRCGLRDPAAAAAFRLREPREQELKGFTDPVRAYSVTPKVGKAIPPPDPHAVPVQAHLERTKRQWIAVGAIALLIIVGGGLAWLQPWKPREEPASMARMVFPLPEKPSVAVLPFDNLSGDPAQDYFSDGLSQSIISTLSKVPRLFVIARNSTFTYKNKPVKVQQVAEELGVQYVLEGSVQRSQERIRVNRSAHRRAHGASPVERAL